jgi:hypothetical protein
MEEVGWEESPNALVNAVNSQGTVELITSGDEKEARKQEQTFIDLLYSVGNLRKRGRREEE